MTLGTSFLKLSYTVKRAFRNLSDVLYTKFKAEVFKKAAKKTFSIRIRISLDIQ